jgi:uncharacterized protein (DUF305 family)
MALSPLFLQATPVAADAPAPNRGTARFEIRFMENMIDHHAMATEMAQLCVEKATHEELRGLCTQMIADQQAEITEMQSWLQAWYTRTHEPQMTPQEMRQVEQLAALSCEEFEIEFMTMMIRHHWTAVKRSLQCVGRAFHTALEDLCENIITVQIAEILQMRTWLCQWYAICNLGIDGRPRRR